MKIKITGSLVVNDEEQVNEEITIEDGVSSVLYPNALTIANSIADLIKTKLKELL